MKAIDAMIVWTPNTESFEGKPLRGTIAVTPIPESNKLRVHPCSVGACDHNWKEADDSGRIGLMQKYFSQMIHLDFLEPETVFEAISEIEEFREYPFSTEKPEGDDWS